jgi:hypothetical protein
MTVDNHSIPTDDYQRPLFSRCPLYEEIERRFRSVAPSLMAAWSRYKNLEDEVIEREQLACLDIFPPQLLFDSKVVYEIKDGILRESGEQVYRYDCFIGYEGDDELWDFSPLGLSDPPNGEIFRRTLIVSCAADRDYAIAEINNALLTIHCIAGMQALEIVNAQKALNAHIRALVQALRRGDKLPFVGQTFH